MSDQIQHLLGRLGERGVTLAADPLLGAQLEGLFDRAVGRLPHRPISRDAMIDRIADALISAEETPDREALARLNAPDLYLALALAARDERALEIAEAELMPAVRQSVGRIDADEGFVDEVAQRVRERLLIGDGVIPPAITQYRGTGPLSRWVRMIASRIALDLKRADGGLDDDGDQVSPQLPPPSDPELELVWRTCADEYRIALIEAFASLSRRERNLLRQRYLDDLNVETLGRIYRVDPETALRWLKQIEERLAAATRTALRAKLAIDEAQLPILDRLVGSQLQSSLPRILHAGSRRDR
jgi:RNA polymerase sigma-70 factor (ECF subfamily)